MNNRGAEHGLTLIEVIIFGSITGILLLWIGPWLAKPVKIQQRMQATEQEKKALRATDTIVNDLKQAIPGSLSWDVALSTDTGSLAFAMAGDATPPGNAPGPAISIQYQYQPDLLGAGGSLFRIADGSSSVIMDDLLPPGLTDPIFQKDSNLKIVTIALRWQTPQNSVLRVVRRVAVEN